MQNKQSRLKSPSEINCYLPDFCQAESNLLLILVLELVAIVLSLASAPAVNNLFVYIALISVYIQWTGLTSAALLCLLRRYRLLTDHVAVTTAISLLVVTLVTFVLSVVAYYVSGLLRFDLFKHQSLISVVIQHQAVSLILFGLALRYFYVHFTSQQMITLQSQSRLQALQARIRPHFLFNSLNTIASLTHDDPDRAERAIESLADLFRASLKADTSISLNSEIDLTRDYIELEHMRLDERLKVNWDIQAVPDDISLPALTLQPLVENAIYHGIEPLPEGGTVDISIKQNDDLYIQITNPMSKSGASQHRQGNQMALNNISERLQLAFDGQAKIEHIVENDLYKVVIKIPVKKDRPGSKAATS
jgi:two-component system sensor histidine kinase AlgZ